jgi:choline monooxygenase
VPRIADIARDFDPEIPVERAWTPPASWYTDPELFELERRSLFLDHWQPVARTADIQRFTSGCFAGEPWVVTREGSQLRAFSNVCRHKGREVVTGSGDADELVCGYHAWAYDLAGRLRKAPRMAGVADFDRHEMSLPALGLCAWGPWVFIQRHADAVPIRELLPELDAMLERSEWSKLRFAARRSWDIGCNWKVYVDNYLDGGYHIPHMHPTLDAQIDMSSYRTELFDRFSVQTSLPASRTDDRIAYEAKDRIGDRAIYAWIYPCFMINRYGPCMDTNHVIPLGPDRCRVDYEFYFLETDGDEAQRFIEESIAQSDLTQREDIAICESVQRGLRSRSYDRGRYAPTVEQGEHHFHQLLARDYRRILSA